MYLHLKLIRTEILCQLH